MMILNFVYEIPRFFGKSITVLLFYRPEVCGKRILIFFNIDKKQSMQLEKSLSCKAQLLRLCNAEAIVPPLKSLKIKKGQL
jgi:hypothetical protein